MLNKNFEQKLDKTLFQLISDNKYDGGMFDVSDEFVYLL